MERSPMSRAPNSNHRSLAATSLTTPKSRRCLRSSNATCLRGRPRADRRPRPVGSCREPLVQAVSSAVSSVRSRNRRRPVSTSNRRTKATRAIFKPHWHASISPRPRARTAAVSVSYASTALPLHPACSACACSAGPWLHLWSQRWRSTTFRRVRRAASAPPLLPITSIAKNMEEPLSCRSIPRYSGTACLQLSRNQLPC